MNTSVLSACASYIQIRMYLIYLLVHANIAKELQVLFRKIQYINGNFGWFDDRPAMLIFSEL